MKQKELIIDGFTKKQLDELRHYICNPNSQYYNSTITDQIRKLCPAWFRDWDSDVSKEKIKKFVARFGFKPSHVSKDKEEIILAGRMSGYCSIRSDTYDKEFSAWLSEIPSKQEFETNENIKKLRAFINTKGYKPSHVGKDKTEQELARFLYNILRDRKDLVEEFSNTPNQSEFNKMKNWEDSKKFRTQNGYWPSTRAKDLMEKKLGKFLMHCSTLKDCRYDKEIADKVQKGPTYIEYKIFKDKENLITFIKINKRKPSGVSQNREERQMALLMERCSSPSQKCFDIKLKTEIEKLCIELCIVTKTGPKKVN